MINTKTRAGLMGIAAAYLVYMAWQLFEGRNAPDSTMPMWQVILFITLFMLAALAIAAYAIRLWKSSGREDEEEQQSKDSENSMKQ